MLPDMTLHLTLADITTTPITTITQEEDIILTQMTVMVVCIITRTVDTLALTTRLIMPINIHTQQQLELFMAELNTYMQGVTMATRMWGMDTLDIHTVMRMETT
jgi:hypothetical protein